MLNPHTYPTQLVPVMVAKYGKDGVFRNWLGPMPNLEVFDPDTVRTGIGAQQRPRT